MSTSGARRVAETAGSAAPRTPATPLLHALVADTTAPDEEIAAVAGRGTGLKAV